MEQQSSFLSDLLYLFSVTGTDDAYKLLTFLIPLLLFWFIYLDGNIKKYSFYFGSWAYELMAF